MNNYIALLRGVNVSGKNILKMAELREVLEKAGFLNVSTYIQSGNIIFQSNESSKALKSKIEELIATQFGLTVPTLILTIEELKKIAENNPFIATPDTNQDMVYYVFLFDQPEAAHVTKLESMDISPEQIVVADNMVYFFPVKGYGKSKLSNNVFESKLKVKATARNHKTVNKLLTLADNL